MTLDPPPTCDPATDALVEQRRNLDLDDLRFENARLKLSIAERQAEIELLSNRLGILQARLASPSRIKIWRSTLRTLRALRVVLRRG